jgi:hypothetical protein
MNSSRILRNARGIDMVNGLLNGSRLSVSTSPLRSMSSRSPSPKRKSLEVLELEEEIKILEQKLKKCKSKVEELKYRPGGPGYEKAKQRFETMALVQNVKKKKFTKSPKRVPIPRKSIKKAKSL